MKSAIQDLFAGGSDAHKLARIAAEVDHWDAARVKTSFGYLLGAAERVLDLVDERQAAEELKRKIGTYAHRKARKKVTHPRDVPPDDWVLTLGSMG